MAEPTTRSYWEAPAQWADIGTARLAWRRFGSGPPLLLVHGFPLSGFTWRKVLPELAKHHTCYVPDLPGMGETEWTDRTEFSFPGQGRTLKAFVDSVGVDRYGVLAQDTGATFARYLALFDDPRVEKLAIINSEVPHHRPPWIPLYQFLMELPGAQSIFRLLLQSDRFRRSGMGFGGCFTDLGLLEGDFHEHVVEPLIRSPHRMDGMRRYLTGLKWDPVDALEQSHARIKLPVQLIWGADDPTFPVEAARQMVEQFPDGRLLEIPGAKLLVHEEKPQEVARAVLAFFA